MIIVNLKGGLGNQMFQYALGRRLAISNEDELALDVSGLERANAVGDIYRPFALSAFRIKARIASAEDVRRLKYPYGLFSKGARAVRMKLLGQTHIGWEPEMLRARGNLFLDGYWQSPRYFTDIREEILADFTLAKPLGKAAEAACSLIAGSASVSIHIRRGDYTTAKNSAVHGLCSLAYYERAIRIVTERTEAPHWFVFSDDIAWAKANLPLRERTTYVSGEGITDAEELTLMSRCAHNIIANSSFSWWGAWLNRNPAKVVVAPTPWFNTRDDHHQDLIPDTWITLPKN